MKEFELQSEFPCLVVSDNAQEFLSPTDVITVCSNNVYIYPAECKEIFPFKINFENETAKNYRIIKDGEKVKCFVFSPLTLSRKNVEQVKVGSNIIKIILSKGEVVIKSNDEELSLPVTEHVEYVCKAVENFVFLLLKNKKNESLILYNPKTKVFKSYKGKDFNLTKNEITFKAILTDFAKSSFEKKLVINKDELTEKTISFQREKYYLQSETFCYAFLECMLNKNFSLAREFLSSNFDNIEDTKFDEFFGHFYKFFFISPEKYLLVYKNENKIVNFKTDNGVIFDFEIV